MHRTQLYLHLPGGFFKNSFSIIRAQVLILGPGAPPTRIVSACSTTLDKTIFYFLVHLALAQFIQMVTANAKTLIIPER